MATSSPVRHLSEVGALGRPHWGRSKTENNCSGEESVELWIELGADVGGVAEDARNQSPLHCHLLDHDGGDEHAGEDQGGVEDSL